MRRGIIDIFPENQLFAQNYKRGGFRVLRQRKKRFSTLKTATPGHVDQLGGLVGQVL